MHKKTSDGEEPIQTAKEQQQQQQQQNMNCLKTLKDEIRNLDEKIKKEKDLSIVEEEEEEGKENAIKNDKETEIDEDVDVENMIINEEDDKLTRSESLQMDIEKSEKTLAKETKDDSKVITESANENEVKKTLKNLLNQESVPIVKSRKPRNRKKNLANKQSASDLINGRFNSNLNGLNGLNGLNNNHYSLNFNSSNQSDELDFLRTNSIAQLRAKALEHSAKVLQNAIYSNLSHLNSSTSSPSNQQLNQNESSSQLPKSTTSNSSSVSVTSLANNLTNQLQQSNSMQNLGSHPLNHHNAVALSAALSAAAANSNHSQLAAFHSSLTAQQQLSIYNNLINTPSLAASINQHTNSNGEENSCSPSNLTLPGDSILNGFGQIILY